MTRCRKTLGGVVSVSSDIKIMPSDPSEQSKNTPYFMSHGLKDSVIHIDSARERQKQLKKIMGQKCQMIWKEYDKGHSMINSAKESKELAQFFSDNIKMRNIALEDRDDLIQIN